MMGVKGVVRLGVDAFNDSEPVELWVRNGGNMLCIASPRYGKGALCKNVTVQISKIKKVCIFDYRGEWANHVTRYNPESQYPDCLTDYFLAENFAFSITDFDAFGDWIGFGFEDDSANFLYKMVKSDYHGGDLTKFREMITELPVSDKDVNDYNEKFGVDFLVAIHSFTKGALGRRFEVVQRFFWKGESDSRQRIDFEKAWLNNQHLIIDLSDRKDGFKDIGKARAYAGLILRKMQRSFERTQGLYVIEEGSQLLAAPKRTPEGGVIGVSEFHKLIERMVTLSPKQGVLVLIMAQSRRQLYDNVLVYLPIQFVGRLNPLDDLSPAEQELNGWINIVGSMTREWFMIDTFYGKRVKFIAALPCCAYETNK